MADQQIEDLTAITTLADGDELLINDVSDTTDDAGGSPKKMVASNVLDYMRMPLDTEYDASSAAKAKTLVVNQITPIDLSDGTLNGNVIVTLPSASAGDRTGMFIIKKATVSGSFAQAPGYAAELATGSTIHTVSYTQQATGTAKYGLWLPGEMLILRYIDATFGWLLEYDGRIQCVATGKPTSDVTTNTIDVAKDFTLDAVWSVDNMSCLDAANDHIDVKRAGEYSVHVGAGPASALTDGKYYVCAYGTASATAAVGLQGGVTGGAVTAQSANCVWPATLSANATIYGIFQSNTTNAGAEADSTKTFLALFESLQR